MLAYPSKARLHHIAVNSPDPARMAKFYAEAMQMSQGKKGDFDYCEGAERRMLFKQGKAKSLGFGAYAFESEVQLEARRDFLKSKGIAIKPSPSPLFDSRAFAFTDIDGNTMVFGLAPEDKVSAGTSLGARIQHLVVASPEPGRLAAFYADAVGLWPSDQAVDDKGVVRSIWLRTDHEHHSFAAFTGEVALDHYSFELPDWNEMRNWADHFAALEIQLIWGPGRHGPGNNLFIFIVDPDGNKIELSAEMDHYTVHRPLGIWPFDRKAYNLWGPAPLRVG